MNPIPPRPVAGRVPMRPLRMPAAATAPLAFRLADAAAVIGVSPRTMRRLVAAGDLVACRIGRALVFEASALEAFLAGRRIGQVP